MAVYEIKLSAAAQTFTIALGGITYTLTVYWNPPMSCWMLDIRDAVGAVDILTAIPIITGLDLLGQYKHLALGGSLVVQTDHDANAIPTYSNLGVTSHLFFVTA